MPIGHELKKKHIHCFCVMMSFLKRVTKDNVKVGRESPEETGY